MSARKVGSVMPCVPPKETPKTDIIHRLKDKAIKLRTAERAARGRYLAAEHRAAALRKQWIAAQDKARLVEYAIAIQRGIESDLARTS